MPDMNRFPKHTRDTRKQHQLQAGRRRRLVYVVVALLALVLVASLVYRTVLPWASAVEVKPGARAPELTFTAADGVQHRLSDFHGRPVMLWFFASWCSSCEAGTEAVAHAFPQLEHAGLQIVQLRLYQNLGYPGPSAAEFGRAFAYSTRSSSQWLWGESSREASYTYDPRGYPDVYFLIDKNGIIREISSGPSTAIDQILSFARRGR